MIKVYLDYSKITLGEAYSFKSSILECDGDKKKMLIKIGEKK